VKGTNQVFIGEIMKKPTIASVFKSANADANDTIKRAKVGKTKLANAKAKITAFIRVIRPLMDSRDRLSIYTGFEKPQILISMRELDSFKQGRIVDVLKALEVYGECRTTRDWAESINRYYHYDMPEFTVALHAYVKEDSPTCRKVAVGTATETVVKYEIQCD
jgi:hypothetical protein